MSILSDYSKIIPSFFKKEPIIKKFAIGLGATAVQIEDGSVGISFTITSNLDQKKENGPTPSFEHAGEVKGMGAFSLLENLNSENIFLRCVGLSALNSLSQSLFSRGLYKTEPVNEIIDLLDFQRSDNVVMLGAVKSMFKGVLEKVKKLTVVERGNPAQFLTKNVEFVKDFGVVKDADIVLIASRPMLLLNLQLKEVLSNSVKARERVVMGPNYGMIPDILFENGVTRIGSRKLTNNEKAVQIVMEGGKRNGFNEICSYYSISKK
ncbi:MAG: Rossmann-like domain-containing protein [Candidatus Ranarchaeia archaeon]